MSENHQVTLAIASCDLPWVLQIFQEIKSLYAPLTLPDRLDEQGFLDLVAATPPLAKALPLTLADPQSRLRPIYSKPLIFIFREAVETIESQIPAEQRSEWTLIPLVIPARIKELLEEGDPNLRVSFCGRDLYNWHERNRPAYTSPWSEQYQFGITFWGYSTETPCMTHLQHFEVIQLQELATFLPFTWHH